MRRVVLGRAASNVAYPRVEGLERAVEQAEAPLHACDRTRIPAVQGVPIIHGEGLFHGHLWGIEPSNGRLPQVILTLLCITP